MFLFHFWRASIIYNDRIYLWLQSWITNMNELLVILASVALFDHVQLCSSSLWRRFLDRVMVSFANISLVVIWVTPTAGRAGYILAKFAPLGHIVCYIACRTACIVIARGASIGRIRTLLNFAFSASSWTTVITAFLTCSFLSLVVPHQSFKNGGLVFFIW